MHIKQNMSYTWAHFTGPSISSVGSRLEGGSATLGHVSGVTAAIIPDRRE